MHTAYVLLYIIAAICFALSVILPYTTAATKMNFIGLGLLAWVMVPLLQTVGV